MSSSKINNIPQNNVVKIMPENKPIQPRISLEQEPDEFVRNPDNFKNDPDVAAYEYSKTDEGKKERSFIEEALKLAEKRLAQKNNNQD